MMESAMKLCGSVIFFIIFVIAIIPATGTAADWRVMVIDTPAEVQSDYHCRIVLDGEGYPHMVYGERAVNHVYLDPQGWHKETVAVFGTPGAAHPAVAIDNDNCAHIVYRNHELAKLVYATKAGSAWQTTLLDYDSTLFTVVADPNNGPHILHRSFVSGSGIFFHTTPQAGVWTTEQIDEHASTAPILALFDSADSLHVIYITPTEMPSRPPGAIGASIFYPQLFLTYATNKSGVWSSETLAYVDVLRNGTLNPCRLYMDENAALHVFYTRTFIDPDTVCLDHALRLSGGWSVETVPYADFPGSPWPYDPVKCMPLYFGAFGQEAEPRQFDYLFKYSGYIPGISYSGLYYGFIENGRTWAVPVDINNRIAAGSFNCVPDPSGYLHAAYFDVNECFKYATNRPVKKGDISADGTVGLKDALIALQILSGSDPEGPVTTGADVDGDGRLGMENPLYILREVSSTQSPAVPVIPIDVISVENIILTTSTTTSAAVSTTHPTTTLEEMTTTFEETTTTEEATSTTSEEETTTTSLSTTTGTWPTTTAEPTTSTASSETTTTWPSTHIGSTITTMTWPTTTTRPTTTTTTTTTMTLSTTTTTAASTTTTIP
jgi:hypothetical protein